METSSKRDLYARAVEFLRIEADAIVRASEQLDAAAVNAALDLLAGTAGKVIVTGVGKSGIIAEKIAQTLTSTGRVSIFVHPTDALHGGLGVVSAGDVVIALSNSGETDELIALLPAIRKRNVPVISVVGEPNSTIAKASDVVLDASVDREVCPFDLAPTASTTVALAIGDALAIVLMERRGISAEDFAFNHPAGRLGKRLTLTVGDLMHRPPAIHRDANWLSVVKAISDASLGAVNVVLETGQLAGIVTDGDLRRTIERTAPERLGELTAAEMMTAEPITTTAETLAFDALRLMEERSSQISVLPVVDGGQCVGLIRIHDIIRSGLA